MTLFLDELVPNLLGMPLRRVRPEYPERMAIQPIIAHDFRAVRGKQVELNRYAYWSRAGKTKSAYSRDKSQTIGTNRSEALTKNRIFLTLTEFTGPNDGNTGEPSSLHITYEDMEYARVNLYQSGNLQVFHDSIGSQNLADDFQSWEANVFLQELMTTSIKRNPGGAADNATYATTAAATISNSDLLYIAEQLSTNNTERFSTPIGLRYHALVSPVMYRHLKLDPDFLATQRAIIQNANINPMSSQLMGGNLVQTTPSGMNVMAPQPPLYYGDFAFYESITLGTLARTTTSSITSPSLSNRPAQLGLFFGMGAVGEAVGGPGPVVLMNNNTDYDRHFNFIWRKFGDYKYLLNDTENSGICIEGRTYAP